VFVCERVCLCVCVFRMCVYVCDCVCVYVYVRVRERESREREREQRGRASEIAESSCFRAEMVGIIIVLLHITLGSDKMHKTKSGRETNKKHTKKNLF